MTATVTGPKARPAVVLIGLLLNTRFAGAPGFTSKALLLVAGSWPCVALSV